MRAGQLSRDSRSVAPPAVVRFLDSTLEAEEKAAFSFTESVARSITSGLRGLLCPTGDHSPA